MTDPQCPGCRERDAHITALQRRVAELESDHPTSPLPAAAIPLNPPTDSGPADPATNFVPSRKVRRRVRVVTDPGKHRWHRWKKGLLSSVSIVLWVALILAAAAFIWTAFTWLGAGGPPPIVAP